MVSILLAAYQGERFLPEQISSLNGQEYPNFRVLWQDDGSQDATTQLLQSAGPRFVSGCDQGLHLGAVGNFLSLMQQDDAPYTALCDQDDVWHADKLSRCMAAMKAAEAAHGSDTPLLVHHDCRLVDAKGRVLHESFFLHQGWDGRVNTLAPLLVQNNVTGCTCVMNAALRRLVTAHADPAQLFMHDWFIALTAAVFGKILFVDEPLVDYRQHGSNAIGASRHGLLRRSFGALSAPMRAKARIRLTYQHARMFRDAFGEALPPEAQRNVDAYLQTQRLPLRRRIRAIRSGGYLMQSRIARLGQIIFGHE